MSSALSGSSAPLEHFHTMESNKFDDKEKLLKQLFVTLAQAPLSILSFLEYVFDVTLCKQKNDNEIIEKIVEKFKENQNLAENESVRSILKRMEENTNSKIKKEILAEIPSPVTELESSQLLVSNSIPKPIPNGNIDNQNISPNVNRALKRKLLESKKDGDIEFVSAKKESKSEYKEGNSNSSNLESKKDVDIEFISAEKEAKSEDNEGNNNSSQHLVPKGVAMLAGRYLFVRRVEGTTFYFCIDVCTRRSLMCKVADNPCMQLLTMHFRMKNHPHINQLQNLVRRPKKTYLFYNAPKSDLLSYVRQTKSISEDTARELFRQICVIVSDCHKNGLILRDLKMRKFVFADEERKVLKLESLEDAVILQDGGSDLLEEKRGCPVYVAPEILKVNEPYLGKAADVWSLGVVLYTLVVGRYPFNDIDHEGLFTKISLGEYTLPDTLSPSVCCLIRSLLRLEPTERIKSCDILSHQWFTNPEIYHGSKDNAAFDDQCVPNIVPSDLKTALRDMVEEQDNLLTGIGE